MKRILVIIAIIGVGGAGLYYYLAQPEKYTAPEVITNIVTEIEEVDVLEQMVQDAITASSTSIQAAAQEAFDATVLQMEKEIELNVRRGHQEEAELKIEELEKEVGQY